MKTLNRPWFHSFLSFPIPALLSREQFVAMYLPQYVADYRAPTGIRLRPNGRCVMSTPGSYQSQVTKRNGRIDEAYAAYCSDHAAQIAFDAKCALVPVSI